MCSHRQIFTTLGEMTDANKVMNPQHLGAIRQTCRSKSGLIWKSGFLSWITFGWG